MWLKRINRRRNGRKWTWDQGEKMLACRINDPKVFLPVSNGNVSYQVSLRRVTALDLLRARSAERRASRAECGPRSRCLGGCLGLERRLRHSRQVWLQGKHRAGTGDILS